MTLLVTGGTGFVMSNVLREWLTRDPEARAIAVDVAGPDAALERFLTPVGDRVRFVTGDVRDSELLKGLAREGAVTHLVNGAAMTPTVGTTEATQAAMVAGVNVMGAVHALEAARAAPDLKRAIHVSTGSVYGDDGPPQGGPLPEDGFVEPFPTTLYPITKLSAELLAARWRDLFSLPLAMVRLASVYGPMDRWTPGRDYACALNVMANRAVGGESWTVSGAEAVGDWIQARDVGRAICDLLTAPALSFDVYNISHGTPASLAELGDLVCAAAPGARWEAVDDPGRADIRGEPEHTAGAWGAYDNSRLRADTGWEPMPLGEAIADYVAWIRSERAS